MAEKFSPREGVRYVLMLLVPAAVIVAVSLMMTSGRVSLTAGVAVILASYLAVFAVVRSFRRRFMSRG
jgi:glycerol dehydrogenase-like iron-containing ADH family enzyme